MGEEKIIATWYGYGRNYNLGEPDCFEVARETRTLLIGPNGRREMKRSKLRIWFPNRNEALRWAIQRSHHDFITARSEARETADQEARLRRLLSEESV